MKLLHLNVEISRHEKVILPFLIQQNPDIICLQEAGVNYIKMLQQLNYHVTYLPRCISESPSNSNQEEDGVLIATKEAHTPVTHYYYQHSTETPKETFNETLGRMTCNQGVIFVTLADSGICVANTHFTWTPNGGRATPAQNTDMTNLLGWLEKRPAHILCGDFNLARSSHPLYNTLTESYTDTIPAKYASSMDKTTHRFGDDPTRSILFSDYMVDYVFTQPLYTATDVKLHFGISDHAGVTAVVEKV